MASYGDLRAKVISSHPPLCFRLTLIGPFSWEEGEVEHFWRGHPEDKNRTQKLDVFLGLGVGLWLILAQYRHLLPFHARASAIQWGQHRRVEKDKIHANGPKRIGEQSGEKVGLLASNTFILYNLLLACGRGHLHSEALKTPHS